MTSLLTSALGEWPKLESPEGSLLEWTGERAPRPARPDDETRAVRRLVGAVVAAWRDEGAPDAAHAVAALAEAALARPTRAHEWSGPVRLAQACEPPRRRCCAALTRAAVYDPTPAVARACELALDGLDKLAWRNALAISASSPRGSAARRARGAVIVGAADDGAVFESDALTLGLAYVAPGVAYPTHARGRGRGVHAAARGLGVGRERETALRPVPAGGFLVHPSAAPRAMRAPAEAGATLVVYAWTGDLRGRVWCGAPPPRRERAPSTRRPRRRRALLRRRRGRGPPRRARARPPRARGDVRRARGARRARARAARARARGRGAPTSAAATGASARALAARGYHGSRLATKHARARLVGVDASARALEAAAARARCTPSCARPSSERAARVRGRRAPFDAVACVGAARAASPSRPRRCASGCACSRRAACSRSRTRAARSARGPRRSDALARGGRDGRGVGKRPSSAPRRHAQRAGGPGGDEPRTRRSSSSVGRAAPRPRI